MFAAAKERFSELRVRKVREANAKSERQAAPVGSAALAVPVRVLVAMLLLAVAIAAAEYFAYGFVSRKIGFMPDEVPFSLFPFVVVPMLLGMLYGSAATVSVGFVATAAIWACTKFNPCALVCTMTATIVMAGAAKRIRSTKDAVDAITRQLLVQTVLSAGVLCVQRYLVLKTPLDPRAVVSQFVFLFVLTACGVPLTLHVALPIAEHITGRISDFSLSSYANLEAPLLRRLAAEAPGTYSHGMGVADLAQAAADAIGADGLLARIGGYYHDIGKLTNPGYFMENLSSQANPHDALAPSVSKMILASHVKEGLILAREEGLPLAVQRMILAHHGTSPMQWFLMKAAKADAASPERMGRNGAALTDGFYRYENPLPETKEETLVIMADSVEAASRSLRVFDAASITRLVHNVIEGKFLEGQFAQSALSCGEIEVAKKTFVEALLFLFHGRKAYPGHQ